MLRFYLSLKLFYLQFFYYNLLYFFLYANWHNFTDNSTRDFESDRYLFSIDLTPPFPFWGSCINIVFRYKTFNCWPRGLVVKLQTLCWGPLSSIVDNKNGSSAFGCVRWIIDNYEGFRWWWWHHYSHKHRSLKTKGCC